MNKVKYFLFLFIFHLSCSCQEIFLPISNNLLGLNAYGKSSADPFSIISNVASISRLKKNSISVYNEDRFLLKATNYYSGLFIHPANYGVFALKLDYFGFKNFNESQIGLVYAKMFGDNLEAGIKFNYYNYRIPQYANISTFLAETGVIYHFLPNVSVGISVFNPKGGRLSFGDDRKIGSLYKIGVGYKSSEHVLLIVELMKQESQSIEINAGVSYNLGDEFFMNAAASLLTQHYILGGGVGWNIFKAQVVTSFQPHLGLSPGLIFSVLFDN